MEHTCLLHHLKDMSQLEEPFDPKKTTVKDYLIYLVNKSEKLEENQEALEKRLIRLEKDMEKRTVLFEEREKKKNQNLITVGVVFSFLGAIVAAIIETLSKE